MRFVERYLLQLNTEKRRWQKTVAMLTVLSLLVASATVWSLRMTGVTIANGASCGYEEHQHTDECLQDGVLICGYEEHIHSVSCYSDPNADIETPEIWEATLPSDLGSHWSENLARIATSQIGVKESERNFILASDGQTKKGITRYGQWYGNPYGDWSAMFAAFCLQYAGAPAAAIPRSPGVYNMMQLCSEKGILSLPDTYVGKNGNLLFLDTDGNGKADKILIVSALEEAVSETRDENVMTAIGGDWENAVTEIEIAKDDPRILGYVPTAAVREAYLNSLPMYSINKNGNNYIVNVYAIPIDSDGTRLSNLPVTDLGTVTVNNGFFRIQVEDLFDYDLGSYQGAYFGSENSVNVDNIYSIWRYKSGNNNYYLAYEQTNGDENETWKSRADTDISLYLRYTPEFVVTFESDGYESIVEYVRYGYCPEINDASEWTRPGYTLVGWLASDNNTVYSYEELINRPVTSNVTYTAQWRQFVTVHFDTGNYSDMLNPIDDLVIKYGSSLTSLPTPGWKNNAEMAFDGWYLNSELTQPLMVDHKFYDDTTLYAKWSPKEDGYYVYFMDFLREGQTPLVLMTYSVTKNQTASPYTPGNEPLGTQWDGKWYLEKECINPYNFLVPVSQMEAYLIGAGGRDLYLYPGTQEACRAVFVTYGTRVDPITVPVGGTVNLDNYKPQRSGFEFAGWTLKDGTPVSGNQTITETTTFYAKWNAGYVPFEAILRIENANDNGFTQVEILGAWYAKSGSHIRVKSSYSGSGNNRTGTHRVVCVLDGTEYPVYKDAALTEEATLNDVYSTYFIYNNTGTNWTDEVNWDDVYTGGEVPYSTRPVSSAGDTIINFDYMRVRTDVKFVISNRSGYLDIFKLHRDGLLTGSIVYSGTKPTKVGSNVSASGVSGTNTKWTYTAATSSNGSNTYILHDVKYGQRIYDDYPVGGSWLTVKSSAFYTWDCNGTNFTSRRQDLSDTFFSGSGRRATAYQLTAEFDTKSQTALMYAIECLPGEKADFTIGGKGYKVQVHLCEVVNSSGSFTAKELLGCEAGVNPTGSYYTRLNSTNATVGGTSVRTLFGTTYWQYYDKYTGIDSLSDIDRAYIFYYDRLELSISFNFAYDANGNGANEIVSYDNVAFGVSIGEYQFGAPGYAKHSLLDREGYEFAGWLDATGFVLEAEDWESMVSTGDSDKSAMIFVAKWEKISNNVVEYYEDRSSETPFESHYFDDGELLQYPTMTVYPKGWVWQECGVGPFDRFDWDVPMYGDHGVPEIRTVNGEERTVYVIRIYGTWDDSHTQVVYDPNAAQGGVQGSAPTDDNEYTIWQSEVSVKAQGGTANSEPDAIFVGWLLDRNGVVYQPGDHVPVRWPRTMIFTAQWAKPEEVVYLRYDPNGGTPTVVYPMESGFSYKKNATAVVWENLTQSGSPHYTRTGYKFTGWNTEPDGSGISYSPNSTIVLTQAQTTLYAQWEKDIHILSISKIDSEDQKPLKGAIFGLYYYENGEFRLIETLKTGSDGRVSFPEIQTDVFYKLVEEVPPDGYAMITKEIFFKLIPTDNTVSFTFCDSEGNPSDYPNAVIGEYVTGNKTITITVGNLRGYALPSTGGTGLLLYVLCGLTLVTAPLVYGFSLRRGCGRRSKG